MSLKIENCSLTLEDIPEGPVQFDSQVCLGVYPRKDSPFAQHQTNPAFAVIETVPVFQLADRSEVPFVTGIECSNIEDSRGRPYCNAAIGIPDSTRRFCKYALYNLRNGFPILGIKVVNPTR